MSHQISACIQGMAALLSVGTAGASAFTGNTVLMVIAVAAGVLASYITVRTVRARRGRKQEQSQPLAYSA